MAFCKYCGSSISNEAEFCPECGKKAPGGNRSASPFTAQESFTREPLSRKEFCDTSFSPDVKKRVRANWIALAAGGDPARGHDPGKCIFDDAGGYAGAIHRVCVQWSDFQRCRLVYFDAASRLRYEALGIWDGRPFACCIQSACDLYYSADHREWCHAYCGGNHSGQYAKAGKRIPGLSQPSLSRFGEEEITEDHYEFLDRSKKVWAGSRRKGKGPGLKY